MAWLEIEPNDDLPHPPTLMKWVRETRRPARFEGSGGPPEPTPRLNEPSLEPSLAVLRASALRKQHRGVPDRFQPNEKYPRLPGRIIAGNEHPPTEDELVALARARPP